LEDDCLGSWDTKAYAIERRRQIREDSVARAESMQAEKDLEAKWNRHPAKKIFDSAAALEQAGNYERIAVFPRNFNRAMRSIFRFLLSDCDEIKKNI